MKKLSKLHESIWSNMNKRSEGTSIRKEDGVRVTTCLGTNAVVSPDCDYDSAIKNILDNFVGDYSTMYVVNVRDSKYTPDEMVNIRKWEAPYTYMIYEGGSGTDLILDFETYDTLVEQEHEICEYVSENDYPAICRCIAEKFKQFGDHLSYIHNKFERINGDSRDVESYSYVFRLIDEDTTYDWTLDKDEFETGNYVEDFIEDIRNTFAAIDDQCFVTWNFHSSNGSYIAIPINFDNLINLKDYIEYTEKWFEVK